VYASMERGRRLGEAIEKLKPYDMTGFKPLGDLETRVRKVLDGHPTMRWDAAIAKIVADRDQLREGASGADTGGSGSDDLIEHSAS
jgi:hypothetical protein